MTAPRDVEELRCACGRETLHPHPETGVASVWRSNEGVTHTAAACTPDSAAVATLLARLSAQAALLEDAERYCTRAHAVVEAARADIFAHATIGVDLEERVRTSLALDAALSDLPPNPLERIRAALHDAGPTTFHGVGAVHPAQADRP